MSGQYIDKEENTGLRHLVNATRFSIAGLQSAFVRESAFRQEILLFALLLPSGAWFADTLGIFIALLCACLLVLTVELLNSGIEAAVDRVGTEHNELSGRAKDYGSAAVMLSLVIVASTWCYILIHSIFYNV